MYCKMLIAEVKASRPMGGPSEHAVRRSVFKHHMKEYKKLGLGQVGALQVKARAHAKIKVDELAESKEHLLAQLSLLRLRQDAESQMAANHIGSHRFGTEALERFAELWPQHCSADNDRRVLPPPLAPPAAMEALLQAEIAKQCVEKDEKPDWLSHLLSHREVFHGVGFYSDSKHPDKSVIYRLMLAIYQPMRAIFLECRKSSSASTPLAYTLGSGLSPAPKPFGSYQYEAFCFVDHWNVPWTDRADMWVLPQCLLRDSLVCTIGQPVLWSVFTRFHVNPTTRIGTERVRGPAIGSVDEHVLLLLQLEFPWLTLEQLRAMLQSKTTLETGGVTRGRPTVGISASSGSSSSRPEPQDVPEDVCAAVHSQLEVLRQELRADDSDAAFFKVRVLGGDCP